MTQHHASLIPSGTLRLQGESPHQLAGKEEKVVIESSGVRWTHLHTGVDDGHKYHQGQQHETGQVETQHEHGAGRREEVGILGGPG